MRGVRWLLVAALVVGILGLHVPAQARTADGKNGIIHIAVPNRFRLPQVGCDSLWVRVRFNASRYETWSLNLYTRPPGGTWGHEDWASGSNLSMHTQRLRATMCQMLTECGRHGVKVKFRGTLVADGTERRDVARSRTRVKHCLA